ncbi:MAG TPA: 16S rRNA (cytidine(1402)-2'-O)-methyltransferase [Candidatus Baltobacteraceae bacterium]|nr:16S rRNA (cytidine(1402)-2'-O)-methyltransferase [Candidatus Baltobacteraceae bacterium]
MPLILVPTPLGNLRDMTLRGLDALRDADLIVAEDTRVARRLLSAYEITGKRLASFHGHTNETTRAYLVEQARSSSVAVVTDAGMPGISDPGSELVNAARAAGISVEVLPGASAFICAAVLSGFDLRRLLFAGFLPRSKREREVAIRDALDGGTTTVWYEAPHRIFASLTAFEEIVPDGEIFVVREFTKLFEQQILGTPAQVRSGLGETPRGEFVIVLAPRKQSTLKQEQAHDLDEILDAAIARGEALPTIARDLARRGYGERAELYALLSKRKRAR